MTERDRQIIALRAKAPKRADQGKPIERQDDASGLALFGAASEPQLF